MTQKTFSKREAVHFGWDAMKHYFGLFAGILIVVAIISGLSEYWSQQTETTNLGLNILINIVSLAISFYLQVGIMRTALMVIDKKKPEFRHLWTTQWDMVGNYFLGSLLYGLIVLGGLILLIIPGIYWAVKYHYFGYLIVDKNMSPITALKKSAEISEGARWDILIFEALLGFINIAGALALVIGLFATVPTTWVAQAFVYRKLAHQTK